MFSTSGIQHQAETAGPTSFGGTIYGFVQDDSYAYAEVTFGSNGSISTATFLYTVTDSIGGDSWYAPATTGIGSSYWIRASVTSGTSPTGTSLNTWNSLSSPATWTLEAGFPGGGPTNITKSCTILVEISSNSSGSIIVASGSVNMIAQVYFDDGGGGGGNIP